VTQNLLTFDIRASQPLRILPLFPVTLRGKKVYIDMMVFHDPLDFNLLLDQDYVYAMRYFVSTLFRVMFFPHNKNIVTIEQILVIDPHLMVNHPPSLNGPYMLAMSTPPQVNYVSTCPMNSTPNEREYIISPNLDLVVDMVISSIWLLEPYLPTLIKFIDMYSFRSVFLPSSEDLLESMIDVCTLT
jgi:hypothetical protein